MKKIKVTVLAFITLVIGYGSVLGQVTIYPIGAGAPLPTCTTIELGESIDFIRNQIGTATQLVCDNDINFSNLDVTPAIDSVFTANSFTWLFDELGTHNIFCGAPGMLAGGQANVCYNVVPVQAIPTLGEWGLIIMTLLLVIFGLVGLRASVLKKATVTS